MEPKELTNQVSNDTEKLEQKEILSQLSSFTGKLLRDRFGRGPESIVISLDSSCITLQLRNFIGPVEKLLLNQHKEEAFRDTRELVMSSMLPELNRYLDQTIHLKIEDMYYDWDLEDYSGIIVGFFKDAPMPGQDIYLGQEAVHERVCQVTRDCEKFPERVCSFWPNPRTLVIIREGFLIQIEKQLLELGHESTLRIAKRRLEKGHFSKDNHIGLILGRQVSGMYLDWKFEQDKSILVYTFKNE